ncbi:MAG: hypothetical protein IT232_03760 [Flavobacteriales bacterium]|nr:hypothetical protein [Flavobacteriales bacterium]
MHLILTRYLVVVFILNGLSFSNAQSSFQLGMEYFKLRAENHKGLKADSVNISKAITHFYSALHSKADNKSSYVFLLKSINYKASFASSSKAEQNKLYWEGKILGEEAIRKYPLDAEILFWYIGNLGKYAESKGAVAAAKEGLVSKMKSSSEKLLKLDSLFFDGAAFKILGVMNYKAPYIPIILTWPSKKNAEIYLKKALSVNPKSISNLYYYAEFLYEVKRIRESKLILEKAEQIPLRRDLLLEDTFDLLQVKKLLEKIEKEK